MQIDNDLIEYLEGLSMLSLSDDERRSISAQLQEVLDYMNILAELDSASAAEQCSNASESVLRADEVKPSTPVDEIMKNAPCASGSYFAVPKAVE